jgi:hypothetical protein
MLAINLRRADHTRSYSICHSNDSGWEVRLEEDRELKHQVCYNDWHRVERAIAMVRLQVSELTAQGWAVGES